MTMKRFLSFLVLLAPHLVQAQDFFGVISNVEEGQGNYRCGAVLIHPDIMVTSSGCAAPGDIVRVGYKSDNETLAIRTLTDFRTHPGATTRLENHPNDIEVIKLNEAVGSNISALKINDISAIPHDNGETVYYAHAGAVPDVGTFFYGKVALTQEFSTKLIVHNATTVQNEVCEPGYDAFLPSYQSPINERVQLCTTTSHEVGPCNSAAWGSPMWIMNDGEPILVGTASQGSCAPGGLPYIWTRTAFYASWLRQQICLLSDSKPACCHDYSCQENLPECCKEYI